MALTVQQRLDEANAAYHALMTGTSPRVVVDQNGERVEFTKADAQLLYAYIKKLEAQVTPTTPVVYPGPARFIF